jgi:hypothetical protein
MKLTQILPTKETCSTVAMESIGTSKILQCFPKIYRETLLQSLKRNSKSSEDAMRVQSKMMYGRLPTITRQTYKILKSVNVVKKDLATPFLLSTNKITFRNLIKKLCMFWVVHKKKRIMNFSKQILH